ncbi:MAG: hypothetical protein II456_02825 [Firmicutes bacterium]|nr:hypothetical protein [Bacillota bacterium]
MKELQIIIKPEDDGNPLNQEKGREPAEGRTTVGWKLTADDGEVFGDYISMPSTDDRGIIAKAVKLMLQQAYTTEMYLVLEGE